MMIFEPKCVLWKRLGAEIIHKQIKGLSVAEELEFWREQTEKLEAAQQKNKKKLSNKNIQQAYAPLCSAESADA